MKDDPAIQAVRDARHQISESVDHDPQRLVEYYRQRQERYRDRLVSRQYGKPKPPGATGFASASLTRSDPYDKSGDLLPDEESDSD